MFIVSFDTLTIGKFIEISKTGNFYKLLVFRFLGKVISSKFLESRWAIIYNQYLALKGLDESYIEWIKLKNGINSLWLKRFNTGDRFFENLIKIKEADLAKLEARMSQDGASIEESCTYISKFMGYKVTPDNTTIKEFYAYLDVLNKSTPLLA